MSVTKQTEQWISVAPFFALAIAWLVCAFVWAGKMDAKQASLQSKVVLVK